MCLNVLLTVISIEILYISGVDDLFSSLQHIQSRLNAAEERDELAFLKNLYYDAQFQNAVQIHNKVVDISTRSPPCRPTCATSVQASNEMVLTLQYSQSPYAGELMDLLSQPGLRVCLTKIYVYYIYHCLK